MVRIYTKTGDDGLTALIGGKRISKNSLRIQAYGTVDELNAFVGQALSLDVCDQIRTKLEAMQHQLFELGAELADPGSHQHTRVHDELIQTLEHWIDELSDLLPPLTEFILPGGSPAATTLHVARTICRRAERDVIALQEKELVNQNIIRYLNRLSDFLFVAARMQNKSEGFQDQTWKKNNS